MPSFGRVDAPEGVVPKLIKLEYHYNMLCHIVLWVLEPLMLQDGCFFDIGKLPKNWKNCQIIDFFNLTGLDL
jgi:hypothetical protein